MQPEREIVRLGIKVMAEGVVFCREFAFCSDGLVYTRVTNLEDNTSPGWQEVERYGLSPTELANLVRNMENKGWTAMWNPADDPALTAFSRSVAWEG